MLTQSEKLTSVENMLKNAYNALEQLTIGAPASLNSDGKNLTFETRSELLYFINQLENKKAALEGRQFQPYQTLEDLQYD